MLTSSSEPKSRGRAARRASRTGLQKSPLHVPYITRGLPPYDILSPDALDRIEVAANRILTEIGIEFRDDVESVELFRKAGARITQKTATSWNVRLDLAQVLDILKTAPERFTQHARNPLKSVEIGTDATVFAPSYGSPFVMDLDKGRRYGTIEDFRNFVKLAQSSPWLHHSGGTICEPTDLPVNKRHLHMVYTHMRYSDRPFLGSITAPERGAESIEMCRILFGSDFVDNNCVIMGNFNTTSPLVLDGVTLQGIRTYAGAGQGSIHLPFLLGGAVSPVTIAGAVAQNLAESLVSCALTQLVQPGAPAILASFISSLSLRSGSPTFGTPEPALGSLVMGQFARRYRMPLRCSGNFTTSKLPDGQAMQQSMMSMMAAVQCGANYILHSAGFLDGLLSMSYEKFVMDTDMCGALHAYLKGVPTDADQMGVDALAEGGPGAHMFGTAHTLRHYETAYWDSDLDDNQPWETWNEQGAEDMMQRANRHWKRTLAEYQAPPMDPGIDEALKDFISTRESAIPDAWY